MKVGNSTITQILGEFGWAVFVVTIPFALVFWHFRGVSSHYWKNRCMIR